MLELKKPKVLVAIVYTDYKQYAMHLFPKNFITLTYEPKECLFIDERKCPELLIQTTGESVVAVGRQYAIDYARTHKHDYILFLDIDLMPDPNTIQMLLDVNTDICAALVAARQNAWETIGHNYENEKTLIRKQIEQKDCTGIIPAGGACGACMLVSKNVFNKIDYTGYAGPETIPGRYTADDEYLQIRALQELHIRPKINCKLKPWHYDQNGFKYRNWGEVDKWQKK